MLRLLDAPNALALAARNWSWPGPILRNMSIHRIYGAFTKVQEQTDGTLIVEGIASTEAVDSQGEVVKASAMAAALPDYMKFANVREMHQAIAAGKALACSVDEQGVTHITAHVVDDGSCKKVRTNVLQGFSIGGEVPLGGRSKDNAKVIEKIRLSEISLVDRPANPEAMITMFKVDAVAEPDPVKPAEPVKKGMYTVQWAAELCGALDALARDTQWEADFEGDASPIPARLKALCAEMCAILRDLVAEETAEMVGDAAEAEAMEMVNRPGALKKSERVAVLARALLADALKKSITVEQVATLRQKLLDLAGDARWAAAFGDGSGVPGKLKSLCSALAAIPPAVSAEDPADVLGHAATEEAVIGMVTKCHEALAALYAALGRLEWKVPPGKADAAGDLQKADIQKLTAEKAAAEKRATDAEDAMGQATEALKKVMGERDTLVQRLNEERERRGVLKLVPVDKAKDGNAEKIDEPKDPLSLMKQAQARPIRLTP